MSDIVKLSIGGSLYSGWKTARIERNLETIAGGFSLSVSERGDVSISEEAECEVKVNDSTVIKGFVDKIRTSYSATDRTFEVAGRDRAGELVDCSALLGKWEFRNFDLLKFAKQLCEPFGVDVYLQQGLVLPAPSKKLSLNPGDSAFTALEEACRIVGCFPMSNGAGGIILTRAGTSKATTALVEGQNVLSASLEISADSRFREYLVLGQHHGRDEQHGAAAAHVKGTASDTGVKRTWRKLLVRPEHSVNQAQANTRAQWEATTRAARSAVVTVTVQGWTQGNGQPWPINTKVDVDLPKLRVQGEMLITSTVFSLNDTEGTTATLTLKGADGFKPQPVISKATGDGIWKEIVKGV